MCPSDKNAITPLRLVCKAFDRALRSYLFKTLQLEFSKFARNGAPDLKALDGVGELCEAIYLDMMVVRDEEEISRLSEVFQGITSKVPEMETLIQALRKYCMNDTTFDETDFTRVLGKVLESGHNLTRMRINLPFQVVGRTSSTATLLLANILACIANRSEEYKPLEVLVLDHLSDTTVTNLCNNPRDVSNAVTTFAGVKHLVLSIKRQESRNSRQVAFTQQLWFLIRKAIGLESLCIIGWNVKRNVDLRRHRHSVGFNEWTMRSLPYITESTSKLKNLRCLELKRVDIDPTALVTLIEDNSTSLKELYLNEVYIKVHSHDQQEETPLWIGRQGKPRPEGCCWVAEALRNMESLHLDILRVTGLGYDDFEPHRVSPFPSYDLKDPSGLEVSFDQRFVEAVMHTIVSNSEEVPPSIVQTLSMIHVNASHINASNTSEPSSDTVSVSNQTPAPRGACEYDVEAFQRYHQNTTSQYKKCIDGYFNNHNERALQELQRIIAVADRGMELISDEIDRSHEAEITGDGNIAIP